MPTTKRFHINDGLRAVAAIVESCLKRTMVGLVLGVDSGHSWDLELHSSDEAEDWPDPNQYLLAVTGHITDSTESDSAEPAKGSSSSILVVSFHEIRPEITEVDIDFYQEDLREYFGRLLLEMERFWPHVGLLDTKPEAVPSAKAMPKWLPKTPETRQRWKEAYLLLEQQKEQYAGEGERPPSKGDQRTLLQDELGWSRGDDTINHILKAGREGLI